MDTIIQPRLLDDVQNENECMFCIKPVGSTYINYVDTECKYGYFNCGLCTLALENAMDLWHDIINFIHPQRLVFVKIERNCMFCQYPTGPSYGRFVDVESMYGYTYCGKCISSVDRTMELWNTYFAYGRVKYLKDKEIKIKRSSGEIENGWKIDSPLIGYGPCGNEIIYCSNYKLNLTRWCSVDDIIELNQFEKLVCYFEKPVCNVEKPVCRHESERLSTIYE